jgi:hypothetical protein
VAARQIVSVGYDPAETNSQPIAPQAAPSAEHSFRARCEARAYLVAAGEYDLQDTVDRLQADAEANGLVAAIGQDEVQRIMGQAFAAVQPEPAVDRVPDEMPPAKDPRPRAVATSTLQAAEWLVRWSDPKKFEAWLLRHSPAERAAIVAHFNKRRRA